MTKNLPCYKLAAYFAAAQIVQEDIAFDVLGCSPSTLSGYMNAKAPFPIYAICALAEKFQIPEEKIAETFLRPYAFKHGFAYYKDSTN
ncbi:MAG: helix-turn-helix transcriptional regulator [Oscillospiraceae bacterium]